MDREKIGKELEECASRGGWSHCPKCAYKGTDPILMCRGLIEAIIVLLKEQDRIISVLQSDLDETLEVVAEQSNVVRCKDCIYKPHCAAQIHAQTIGKENDWFCADGMRRDV